jgi:hypothetical protein
LREKERKRERERERERERKRKRERYRGEMNQLLSFPCSRSCVIAAAGLYIAQTDATRICFRNNFWARHERSSCDKLIVLYGPGLRGRLHVRLCVRVRIRFSAHLIFYVYDTNC